MEIRVLEEKGRIMSKLELHLAALAAAGAGMGLANQADAAIVWSGAVNINIPSTTAGIYLNVVTNVAGTAAGTPGWDFNPWSSSGLGLFNPAAPAGGVYVNATAGGTNALNLPAGTLISGASLFGSNSSASNAQWALNSSNNLIGFRFQNEANANLTHYGWVRISLGATAGGQPRAIVEYAYNNVAGEGINAGDNGVPTPGVASMLAIGAAGLAGRRRRA